MTKDDIVKIAMETNGDYSWAGGIDWTWAELVRFVNLIAAHEREACAILADECLNIEELGAVIRSRGQQ